MTENNGLPPAQDFATFWTRTVSLWLQADPQTSSYPPLTGRQRALLHQIHPEVLAGSYAIVSTSNRYLRDEIEANLRNVIIEVFSRELGQNIQLSVNVSNDETQPEASTAQQSTTGTAPDIARERRAEEHAREFEATTHHGSSNPNPAPRTWTPMSTPGLEPANSDPVARGMASNSGEPIADNLHQTPRTGAPLANNESVVSSDGPMMNQKYTFENFVTGSSNQLAYAACRAVAEYPGNSYNPLLIWGESGLGKTHLLQAIGHYALELRPKLQIKYVSSEEMTNDFINSISTGRRDEFKRRYRSLDILIVDDIQFLQQKESTQEEFFHTFNALHQAGKQIVLSSDRPPRQLTTLEDRLRTRFESGLITDVQSPDLETRIAILEKKTLSMNVSLPDDVKVWMASRFEKSIRELDGALIRLTAYCQLGNVPITLASAEEALRDLLPDAGDVDIIPALIIEVVSDYFSISPDEITGKTRARQIANARQIAMYLCRELTDLSLPKLGAAFGGRDHTTVMYAERRIHEKIQEDKKTFNQVQELTQRIKVRARN